MAGLVTITVPGKASLWKRQAFADENTGEIYAPAAYCCHEAIAVLCALCDGVPTVTNRGHLYVPLSWASQNFPNPLWDAIRRNVQTALAANPEGQ